MARFWILAAAIAAALAAGVATAQPRSRPAPNLARWTMPTLTPFGSESEFRSYLRDVQAAQRAGYAARSVRRRPFQYVSLQDPTEDPCAGPNPPPECGGGGAFQVTVTGARISNPSITNVQEAGVDEGDIVKQIGRFLIVLQDGRIYSIDTHPANGAGLALVDRADVYRDENSDAWYDEMLVAGNRILITGYSYGEEGTELSVFRLDPETGRLRREGVFYMSSNDYYDTDNYATRIVGDRLVIYTPIDLSDINLDAKLEWPVVRRWQGEESRSRPARGRPLLAATDIYRPVRTTLYPIIHTISVCPLSSTAGGGTLACTTTGFVGEDDREFHVSPTDAYLWITAWSGRSAGEGDDIPDCAPGHRPALADAVPATLFKLSLAGGEAGVIGVRGDPINFLSLDTGGGHFRALVRWPSTRCRLDEQPYPLTLFDTGTGRFGDTLVEAPARTYTAVPSLGTSRLENRFTDRYLVYGGRGDWGSYPPEEPIPLPQRAAVVPLDRPAEARLIDLPHSIIRIEQAGEDAVLTGYHDESGLDVSLIDLSAAPRLASTEHLPGRYESEGRSHAFNSLIGAGGDGAMGVPTTRRVSQSGRWWSYSDASDVSFLAVDASGRLARLGELLSYANLPESERRDARLGNDGVARDYNCEVSCIDWYGNTRPVFTDGRIFALAGTELIEGRIEGGRIREVRRLNMSVWPAR